MRRLLLTSFAVLALVVGAADATSVAYAAADCTAEGQACTPSYGSGTGTCVNDDSGGGLTCTPSVGTVINIDPAAAKAVNDYKTTTDEAYNGIMARIMSLFAWLVGVAAITLDNAVYYTVVTMGTYVNNLSAIGVTWSILRDIGNIFLIFGFLAVGITTILNVDWYGGGKKMLPMMFVAAIFLNFSLFITEAVIDTGNLFATQFYTQINGGNPAGIKSFDPGSLSVSNEGISNKIMGQLGLQTIYGDAITKKEVFKGGAPWFIGFMGIILFIILAFVLFSLAFVLIARFVILIFLIILAPVGFAGLAVPQLASMAKKWWDKLFEQTITAPVLLLMLYIALAVITDVRFLTGFGADRDWTGFVNNSNLVGFASMMLSFLVAMGLLLAVVIFAKNLSAFGASKASQLAGKLTFGATAYGMNTLAGGGAFGLRKTLQRVAPNNRAVRAISNYALRPLEKARFDMRSVGVGAALSAIGMGEAAAPIGASTVGRGKQGVKWVQHLGEEANQDYDKETRIPRLRQAINDRDDVTMGRLIGRMSDAEFESHAVSDLFAHNPAAAANLPQNRFERLMQSDKLSDALKETIRVSRNNGTDARYAATPHPDPRFAGRTVADVNLNGAPAGPNGEPRIPALSSAQRAELPSNVLAQLHVMDMLTVSDFASIARRAALEPANQVTMGNYLIHLVPPVDPRHAQIAALAATNRSFAAYFGIP